MIKFFRRIRKSLLSENNFSKYLLYAIGEIVLVVIGILIALQINNWNIERLNKKEERQYYKNIKRQLQEDKNGILGAIDYNNHYLGSFRHALSIIASEDIKLADSLAGIALDLMRTSDFHRQSNIYQSMVNSGQIKLLKNQRIIERLQQLEETYIYINKLEDTHAEATMTYAVPEIVGAIRVYNMKVENAEQLFGLEFQNLFAMISGLMVEKNDTYKRALKRINELNDLISEELGYTTQNN